MDKRFREHYGKGMFYQCILCLSVLAASPTAHAEEMWPASGILVTEQRLAVLQKRVEQKLEPTFTAFQQLRKAADKCLQLEPNVPDVWYVPGYYDDAQGHISAKEGLMNDANGSYKLALVYRITGEQIYANKAAQIIRAWSKLQKTETKDDSCLSFSYHFPAMILAADVLESYEGWTEEDRKSFKTFVREKALPLNTMSRKNNWGNWGLVFVTAAAVYLEDRELFNLCTERWKEFIELQIADDGHLIHEVNRGEGRYGIWYSHFSLMPQTLAAEIMKNHGVDLFDYTSPSGHQLKKAFLLAAQWANHQETFPYYDGKPEKLVAPHYVSYFEILNRHWPDDNATEILEKLRPLSANHSAPALTFTHGEPR